MEDPDEHDPRRGDPLGEVDVGARRVEVIVVRTHPADEPVLRRQTEGRVALLDGVLLEPDRGGDHVLGLLRGDDETDGVPLPADDIALGSQPHLGLDLGPGGGRGGWVGVDDGGADECQDRGCDEDWSVHGESVDQLRVQRRCLALFSFDEKVPGIRSGRESGESGSELRFGQRFADLDFLIAGGRECPP